MAAKSRSKTVFDLKTNEEAVIKDITDLKIKSKLLSLGLRPKTTLKLIRKSPFGGALYMKFGKTFMAIRRNEAKCILIEPV